MDLVSSVVRLDDPGYVWSASSKSLSRHATLTGPAGLPIAVQWWRDYHQSQANAREHENPTPGTQKQFTSKNILKLIANLRVARPLIPARLH